MQLSRWLRSLRQAVAWCWHAAAWCAGTAWLGVRALWRAGWLLARLPELLAETRPCPRGHAVPMYGVFDCACGAIHEGWVFGRCSVCGQSAGWTPCPECALPVRSPLRS